MPFGPGPSAPTCFDIVIITKTSANNVHNLKLYDSLSAVKLFSSYTPLIASYSFIAFSNSSFSSTNTTYVFLSSSLFSLLAFFSDCACG
jgi:hypothetical protein